MKQIKSIASVGRDLILMYGPVVRSQEALEMKRLGPNVRFWHKADVSI